MPPSSDGYCFTKAYPETVKTGIQSGKPGRRCGTIKVVPQTPPPPPPVDEEKVRLEKQLLEAQRKILLLQEVITIAQAEHGLVLPKKFYRTGEPASRQNCRATRKSKHKLTLPTAWSNTTATAARRPFINFIAHKLNKSFKKT